MPQNKQAKRQAKHEKWIRKLAAAEAIKTAKAFAKEFPLPEGTTPEERQKEFEFDRQQAEKIALAEFSALSAEKYDIKVRLYSTLIKRCGRELALEFVEMVDFKALDEKSLMAVLIKVIQQPELCADRTAARSQWKEFVEPYHAIVAKEIAALEAYSAEQARLRQEDARLREAETRLRAEAERRAEEADCRAEEEAQQRAEADRRAAEEAQQRAEAERRAEEADRRAEEEAQQRAEADRRAEEEAQQRAEADRRAEESAQEAAWLRVELASVKAKQGGGFFSGQGEDRDVDRRGDKRRRDEHPEEPTAKQPR